MSVYNGTQRLGLGDGLVFEKPKLKPQLIKKLKVKNMNKKLKKVPSAGTKVESSTNDEVTTSSQTIAKPNVICSQIFRFCGSNYFRLNNFKKRLFPNKTKRRGIKIIYSSPISTVDEDFEYSYKQFLRIGRMGLLQRLFLRLQLKKLF
jgi:hypothetical protein